MSATNAPVQTNKMAGSKKTKTEVAAPVAAAPVAAAAPAKAVKAPRKAAAKAEVTVPTVAAPVAATETRSSEELLSNLTETLRTLSSEFSARVREAIRGAHAATVTAKREQRNSKRKHKKNPADMTPEERAVYEARRAKNAFLVERPLSDELAHFMGLSAGAKRSQTVVTKFVSEYIKTHNCFDPSFKRRIIPNAALAKLLRVTDKDEVTYLNLQRYLKVHFKKTA